MDFNEPSRKHSNPASDEKWEVPVRVLKMNPLAQLPQYMSEDAAGCDVRACIEKAWEVAPSERVAVPTGMAFEIPKGYEIQVRPRSGLAYKTGLSIVNAPGTIDSDFRGEVKVLLINHSKASVTIEPGERIAQFVLQRVPRIHFIEAESLEDSERGEGGFGSTGKS